MKCISGAIKQVFHLNLITVCPAKVTDAINKALPIIDPTLDVIKDVKKLLDDADLGGEVDSDMDILITFLKVLKQALDAVKKICQG